LFGSSNAIKIKRSQSDSNRSNTLQILNDGSANDNSPDLEIVSNSTTSWHSSRIRFTRTNTAANSLGEFASFINNTEYTRMNFSRNSGDGIIRLSVLGSNSIREGIKVQGSGSSAQVRISDAYNLPTNDGSSGQAITTDGSGNLAFSNLGYTTSFVGSADFTASDNTFYFVNTSSGTTTSVTLPDRSNDTSLEYRFKFFNHGDGTLRILELNNPGLIDPSEDGSNPGNSGSSMKYFNSRCLVEVYSIVGTSHYEWVVSDQLETGKESLSTAGQVLRYNPTNDQMTALPYTFPITDGSADQILKTDGAGVLTFVDQPSGGGGGASVPTVITDTSGTNTTISTTSGIEEIHLISNGTNAVTITLPAAATAGSGYKYNIKQLGTANVTIDGNGSETIDGSSTFVITSQYSSVTLVTDGSNWFII